MLVPLLNIPSSEIVWRGPVPKIQVRHRPARPDGRTRSCSRRLAIACLEVPRHDVADRRAEDVVVWDPEGGEEGHLAEQLGVLYGTGAGCWRRCRVGE